MTAHKNQHFVPRCYLRSFSEREHGNTIHLFNIRREIFVPDAPLKSQCSRPYFYGEDLELEKILQTVEGRYAETIRLLNLGEALPPVELRILADFAYLQMRRTQVAAERLGKMQTGMFDSIAADDDGSSILPKDLDVSERTLVNESITAYVGTKHFLNDLKICLVRNDTNVPFFTSDDPSFLTNKFHIQRHYPGGFGMANSGLILAMPLTPEFLILCYDGLVYTIPGLLGRILPLKRIEDVLSFNDFQALHGSENFYFQSWDRRSIVLDAFARAKNRRPTSWTKFYFYVPDGDDEQGQRFREATEEERRSATSLVVRGSARYPVPFSWPSVIRFRSPVRTFSANTGAGHVRKVEWLDRDW